MVAWKPLRLIPLVLLLCLLAALSAAAQPEAPPRAPSVYDQLTGYALPDPPRPGEAAPPPIDDSPAPRAGDYVFDWSRWAIAGYGPDTGWEIFTADSGLRLQLRLASSPAAEIHPKADRGFRRVVFASDRDGDFEIFSIATDGTDLRQLTHNESDDVWPMWSPDGQRIAYTAYGDGQPEIYVMQADGSEQRRLTNSPSTDAMPDWSPEGDQIVFAGYRDGAHGIFIMDADGSDQRRVTSAVYAQRPKWSLDGTQIAFDADGDGDTWQDLFLMDVNGGNKRMIYNGQSESEVMLGSWSPDQEYLTFTYVNYVEWQGEYYWAKAWSYRMFMRTGETTNLLVGDTFWNGQWQTTDGDPPRVRVNQLPAMTAARGVLLGWSGEDIGASGMRDYVVQVRDAAGQWRTWQEQPENQFWAVYPNAAPGTTGAFRVRARDAAFNISPATAATQTETYFYSVLLNARATDNRGAPLEEARFSLATGDGDAYTGSDGRAVLPLTRFGFQGVALNHEFGSLPDDNRVARPGAAYTPYLTADTNALTNSTLDAGLTGWTAAGSNPPVASADAFRGAGSVRLGATCLAPCLAPAISLGQPELTVRDAVADSLGNIHVVWDGRFFGPNGPVRPTYSMRAANGTWTAAESLDPGHDAGSVFIAVDPAGGFHALWQRSDNGDGRLVYRYRAPNGAWQPPAPLNGTATLAAPAFLGSDSRGTLYALGWEQYGSSEAYLIVKPAGQPWGAAENLYDRLKIDFSGRGATIGPDDRLTILAHASVSLDESGTALLSRTTEGQWSVETGLPFHIGNYAYYFKIDRDGATYIIHSNMNGGETYLYRRTPAGDWSEGTPLPISPYVDGAVDGAGRLHLVGGEGAYVTWTPGVGWQSPSPIAATLGQFVLDAFDLPHIIGQPVYPADNEVLYIGPAAAPAATSTLWQQVTIPANMNAPTLAFMQRRHGERPGGQTALRATVDDAGTITPLSVTSGGPTWSLGWVDLSPWKGKTVKVGFTLAQVAGEPAARAWLDDVTLTPGYADMVVFAAGPRSVGKGRPAQLTIQARNQGGVAAPGATLWVELPDGLTFVSANPPATASGQTVTWTLGDLPAFSPSQTFVVTVRGQTHSGGLTSPYYIRVAADTTTSQRQYGNSDRMVELIIAEQLFLPAIR